MEPQTLEIKTVIDLSTGEEIPVADAVERGIIDPQKGVFINTITGEEIKLDDAVDKGLVTTGEVSSPLPLQESQSYGIPIQSPSKIANYKVHGVTDTTTGEKLSVSQAVQQGILNPSSGEYMDPSTDERMSIGDAIKRGLIDASVEQREFTSRTLSDVGTSFQSSKTTAVQEKEMSKPGDVTFQQALSSGLIDPISGNFTDPTTGIEIPVDVAIKQGLILDNSGKPVKSGTTDDAMTIAEALQSGIIDTKTGKVQDPKTGQLKSIEQSIADGIIAPEFGGAIASAGYSEVQSSTNTYTRSEQSAFTQVTSKGDSVSITSVQPGSKITVDDAVASHLIDLDTQSFIIPQTGQKIPLQDAVEQGYLDSGMSMETKPASGKPGLTVSEAVQQGHLDERTGIFKDPKSGKKMSLEEAVKKGLLASSPDKSFDDEHKSGLSIGQAIQQGLVDTRSGEYINPQSGERMTIEEAVMEGILLPGTFKKGMPLTLTEAERKGIVDARSGTYHNPQTGETLTTDEAIKRGLLQPMSVTEASERGIVDTTGTKYKHPKTGQVMDVTEAIQKGYIEDREKQISPTSDIPTMATIPGFEVTSNGEVVNTTTGVTLSIDDAMQRGILEIVEPQQWSGAMGQRFRQDDELSETSSIFSRSTFGAYSQDISFATLDKSGVLIHSGGGTLPLAQAIAEGLVDKVTGDILDSKSGMPIPFHQALIKAFILPQPSPKSVAHKPKLLSVLRSQAYDMISNTIFDPKSGQKLSLEKAILENQIDTSDIRISIPSLDEVIILARLLIGVL
ncbi:unnamed protein product [Owenia fusiformis]|uniref:Uncharacterized protein n=1 Tax=Owenia fusiformis TaxID=6347 RepID=A0A8J1XZF7_OWEFU|nr:unnamed protein product [Owenia fusiformis]